MDLKEVKKMYNEYTHITDEARALMRVKKDGYALQFVNIKTPEICLEAVKQNGHALQFVNIKTPEICLEAVKQDEYALPFVNHAIFKDMVEEITMEDLCKELGRNIKIIK